MTLSFSALPPIFRAPLTIIAVALVMFSISIILNISTTYDQQYRDLASSFLQGKLYFINDTTYDTALANGYRYWPLGPFPAVMLMPFVFLFSLFSQPFLQGYVHFFLGLLAYALAYGIARRVCDNRNDAHYWAAAFCFASSLIGVLFLPAYSYVAHLITVVLLLAAFYEYLTRRRSWLIGAFFALILATRATAVFGILFFLLDAATRSMPWKEKMRCLAALIAPVAAMALVLGLYNFARFGTPFEQGYGLQTLIGSFERARSYGLFSITHIPGNLYYMFLASPLPYFRDNISRVLAFPFIRPDHWGMSIFITSPYLLLLFFFSYRERIARHLIAAIVSVAVPLILYYGIGFRQFGNRYALDFFPLLFFLFLLEYYKKRKTLSTGMKAVIVLSALVNLYLFFGFLYYASE